MSGCSPFWDLSHRQCPVCPKCHPLDIVSSMAFCDDLSSFRERMAYAWGPVLGPVAIRWLGQPRTKGGLRNFAQTLVPKSLYDALMDSSVHRDALRDALKPRRSALTSIIESAGFYRRDHPMPDSLPPPLSTNTFFKSEGPYSTTDRPPPRRDPIYHPSPPLPPQVQAKPKPKTKRKRQPDPHAPPAQRPRTVALRQSSIRNFLACT